MKKCEIEVCFKSQKEIESDCRMWASQIKQVYCPDLIVFVAKSGFLFARPLSEVFNCPIVDVIASREDNKTKDNIKRLIPWLPKSILSFLLRSRVSATDYHHKSNRIVNGTKRYEKIGIEKYKSILLLDDSVDTGWSLLKVEEYLDEHGAKGKYKTASYCVLSESMNRVNVDFCRYTDKIVISATSRYSKEHSGFLRDYNDWKKETDTIYEG